MVASTTWRWDRGESHDAEHATGADGGSHSLARRRSPAALDSAKDSRAIANMPYTDDDINWIYDRTGGACFYCGIRLSFHGYGKVGATGAWEADHFYPFVSGGAHKPYNLVPACIDCNTRKSDLSPWEFDSKRFMRGDRNPDNYI